MSRMKNSVLPAFGSAPKCRAKGGCSAPATHRITAIKGQVRRTGDVCDVHSKMPEGWAVEWDRPIEVLPEPDVDCPLPSWA